MMFGIWQGLVYGGSDLMQFGVLRSGLRPRIHWKLWMLSFRAV